MSSIVEIEITIRETSGELPPVYHLGRRAFPLSVEPSDLLTLLGKQVEQLRDLSPQPVEHERTALTRLLTTQELASRFGVHEHTVRRWVAKGCPHEALPGEATRFRFDLGAVTGWLKTRRAA